MTKESTEAPMSNEQPKILGMDPSRLQLELNALGGMSQAVFSNLGPKEVIDQTLDWASQVVGADSGSFLLATPEGHHLKFIHSKGPHPVPRGTSIPWTEGIAGSVFQSGHAELVREVDHDPRHLTTIDQLTGYKTHDLIAVPVKRLDGEAFGVMEIVNKREGGPNENDVRFLNTLSSFLSISLHRASLLTNTKKEELIPIVEDYAHDMKNMVMVLGMGRGLLQEELQDFYERLPQEEAHRGKVSYRLCQEIMEMIGVNALRIQTQSKDLLDCIEGLTSPFQLRPCHIENIALMAMDPLRLLAKEKGICFRLEGLEDLPPIQGDERRLVSVLYNLIHNALPEVPPTGVIAIRGQREGQNVVLTVSDTGRGMPPEVRERLFTNRARSQKANGNGLGTKIVKDVVDAHGGNITVESDVGKGTTFFIRLPIERHNI